MFVGIARFKLMVVLAVFISLLTGCFGLGSKEEADDTPHYYIIDVDRGAVANRFPDDRTLYLKPVTVTSHFRGKTLVFRIGENEFRSQPPHEFFSEPEEMFTEQLRRWLQKSGMFSQVVTTETSHADFVLETAVTALYGEKREQFSPQAALEMQFFLSSTEKDKAQTLFQTGLRIDVDVDSPTPANIVKGWQQGLEELLATVEDDLSGYFAKRTP
ncbi:ABC transporter [Methylophaga sp. 41_12_T18]|nr:ABC transporter [Methylophaga sp. 41_12_T18]